MLLRPQQQLMPPNFPFKTFDLHNDNMPLYTILKYQQKTSVANQVTEVYIWHITESEEQLINIVGEDCLKVIHEIPNVKRRLEWLSTQALLGSIRPGFSIKYYPNGKPYLLGLCQEKWYLSISHTGHWLALAISPFPIGIDIEQWSSKPYRISSKFLSANELSLLNESDNPSLYAMNMWTAKEAAFKCFDQIYTKLISDINIAPYPKSSNILIAQGKADSDIGFVSVLPFPKFAMSICTFDPLLPILS